MKSILLAMLTMLSPFVQAQERPLCEILGRAVAKGTGTEKLHKVLDELWKYSMRESPESATYLGYPGYNDRWTDFSLSAIDRRKQELKCQALILKKISRAALKGEDLITYDLQVRENDLAQKGSKFGDEFLVLDQLGGIQIGVVDILEAMPKAKIKDVDDMIKRLENIPTLVDEQIVLMTEGLKRKVTPVKAFLAKVPLQMDKVLTEQVEDSPLFKAFSRLGSDIPETDQVRLRTRAKDVLAQTTYPAMKKMRKFLVDIYIPQARETTSFSSMPNGKEWYAYLVNLRTTTKVTPQQLHDLGLKEVERITKEMDKIREQVGFKGDLKAFNQFLLTDKQFYYTEAKDLLTGYRDLAKQIDAELPKFFKVLPRNTYGVREMALHKAAEAPTAYYYGGSLAGGRPGFFEANTYDLKARPKWGMAALTLHESVPGHHLQISLAQELDGLPETRRNRGNTAYVEGWALYAESLGEEFGLYEDAYSNYGRYGYEIWRAVRLVVDTGLHEFGWSRQKAIDYFMEKTPKSKLESEAEVDRYISMPGQALAYKVGQLKFLELRARAKKELGDKYDIREFHEEVLKHGALPMDVLEGTFTAWLDQQKTGKADVKIQKRNTQKRN